MIPRVDESSVGWIRVTGRGAQARLSLRVASLEDLRVLADEPLIELSHEGLLFVLRGDPGPPSFDPFGASLLGRDVALPSGTVAWRWYSLAGAVALTPDGALFVRDPLFGSMTRLEGGAPVFSVPVGAGGDSAIVDRDGVLYFSTDLEGEKPALVGVDRKGDRVLRVEGRLRALAIDGLGRILALRRDPDELPHLVAIA